jgi:hypothetical protein
MGSNADFRTELKALDIVQGRLVSGQKFSGKIFGAGPDYVQVTALEVENSAGEMERQDTDIVRLRLDAIMYFDGK